MAVIKTVEMLIEANNFIQPIALGMQGTISEAGSLGNVTGWGLTEVKKDDRLQGLFVKDFNEKPKLTYTSCVITIQP